jgi:DHA1 family multidrug resistance protein-like MFS transporter
VSALKRGNELDTGKNLHSYRNLLLTCCLVSFACNVGSYMRIPIVPLYARSLGADTFQVGLINSAFLFMAASLSLPFGKLSDRMGRKFFILTGALVSAGSSYLLYFSRTPVEMICIYLFFGIGLAAFNPTMMSYVADISPDSHLGRSYGWYTMALYSGMTIGPAAGGFLGHSHGLREVFLISGTFVFLMTFMIVFFIPGSRIRPVAGASPVTAAAGRGLLENTPLLGCWLATLGSCFGYGTFMTFVPLHANKLGMNAGDIGLVFAAQALSNAVSRMPFGYLSDRAAKRSHLAIAGILLFALSLAGLGLSVSLPLFLLFSSSVGIGMSMVFTSLGALVSQVVPRESRGLAMGGYNTCIYLGMMLSSFLMGLFIRGYGFECGFFMTAFVVAMTAGVFFVLIRNLPAK